MAHLRAHDWINKLSSPSLHPEIACIAITKLRPWTRNARTHSRKQLRQIADSIERFGFTNPVLVDGENRILAGHGRVEAAQLIGMTEVPCLCFDHMSASEKRAYVLADNKLALNAGWDEELLALELKELSEADLDFSLDVTGFSIAEVDGLIEGLSPEEAGDPAEDALPNPATTPRRCKPGDIYRLGPHRLICGDALDARTVEALMDGETAEMVFTDPPYNVRIDGNVSGLGKVRHEEFAMASGEMSPQEFTAFLSRAFANLAAHCESARHLTPNRLSTLTLANRLNFEAKAIAYEASGGVSFRRRKGSIFRAETHHAPGHISYWREVDRTLVVGDAFITTAQESAYAVATQAPELHGPPIVLHARLDRCGRIGSSPCQP